MMSAIYSTLNSHGITDDTDIQKIFDYIDRKECGLILAIEIYKGSKL